MVFRDNSYICLVLVREDPIAILETRKALKLCVHMLSRQCVAVLAATEIFSSYLMEY